MIKFAVYGTLKKGHGNHYLIKNANYLGSTTTEGEYTMYSMGGFPAVVKKGNTPIHIEVYETEDQDMIDRLNRLEGFTGIKDHPQNWYNRITISTKFGDAEMYVFDNPPKTPTIENGKW